MATIEINTEEKLLLLKALGVYSKHVWPSDKEWELIKSLMQKIDKIETVESWQTKTN